MCHVTPPSQFLFRYGTPVQRVLQKPTDELISAVAGLRGDVVDLLHQFLPDADGKGPVTIFSLGPLGMDDQFFFFHGNHLLNIFYVYSR